MLTARVLDRLKLARKVVVFTGAGISAESGIQTFRAAGGLWERHNPDDVATPQAFLKNPQLVWDFYCARATVMQKALPNAAHKAIAALEGSVNVIVITQNIDNLHQKAGSTQVLELHGNIIRLKSFEDEAAAFDGDYDPVICPVCDAFADPNELDPYASKGDLAAIQLVAGAVPTCPCCKALQRPDVVWFGEHLPVDVLTDAIAAIAACDAMFVVGTSMQVQPAASMPFLALEKGAVLIEVNPEPCLAEYADAVFDGTAAEVLPKLIQQVWQL